MTEIITIALGAVLIGFAAFVGRKNGYQAGHSDGYLIGWRDHAATVEPRPQRGADGRFKPKGVA